MHIIYIEFGISKSSQYKKVCNLAKQLPNYTYNDGITKCFVDDMKDYVRGWYEYDFDEDKHIFKTVNEITLILENVYAWKELIPPKELDK